MTTPEELAAVRKCYAACEKYKWVDPKDCVSCPCQPYCGRLSNIDFHDTRCLAIGTKTIYAIPLVLHDAMFNFVVDGDGQFRARAVFYTTTPSLFTCETTSPFLGDVLLKIKELIVETAEFTRQQRLP